MKFSQPRVNPRVTTNFEGESSYRVTPEVELINLALCSLFDDSYYESNTSMYQRLQKTILKCDPEFARKLVVYAREKMHMRTMPIVLMCELAKIGQLDVKTVYHAIQRPDEIIELLARYAAVNSKNWQNNKKLRKISNAVLKGIKQVFESGKFNEYQYAKYNTPKEITFRDAIFLTHPKPPVNDEMIEITKGDKTVKTSKLYYNIINDSLTPPYTWEVELSEVGKKASTLPEDEKVKLFKEKWEEIIDSGKLGYMAMLRNLRNFVTYRVSETHIDKVCRYLEANVVTSKQFPFRFLSAYMALKNAAKQGEFAYYNSAIMVKLYNSLEKCALKSVDNIEGFADNEKILIACDVSGSMLKPISQNSDIQNYDIGLLLSLLLKSKYPQSVYGIFGRDFRVGFPVEYPSTPLRNVVEMYKHEGIVGYATNGYKVLEWALNQKQEFSKIIIFTDCQMWNTSNQDYQRRSNTANNTFWDISSANNIFQTLWNGYKQQYPNAKLYLFNLAGYNTVPIDIVTDKSVFLISGWSNEVFKIAKMLERPMDIVKMVKEYVV